MGQLEVLPNLVPSPFSFPPRKGTGYEARFCQARLRGSEGEAGAARARSAKLGLGVRARLGYREARTRARVRVAKVRLGA